MANKIRILDCTLRDGGYINDWRFGGEAIRDISEKGAQMGADVVELGFLRDLPIHEDTAIFSSPKQLTRYVPEKKKGVRYSVMAEMNYYFPWEKITPRTDSAFDMIRYTFWKRCLDEGLAYAKKIREKGYDLGVQATRVEQYTQEDFADMIRRFQELEPYAIYIVDTFGLLTEDMLLRYVETAHSCLRKDVLLGYHAHNNMQQAVGNAEAFVQKTKELGRDVIVDVSAFGMGRGAGNLPSEIFLAYLNQNFETEYQIGCVYEIWDRWLKDIYEKERWGYTLYYYLSARYRANPNYASYFGKHGFSVREADEIFQRIPYEERIRFSEETIKKYMR